MNKYQNSIDVLNQAVGAEIATVLQYIYFHTHCDDQGYSLLARLFKTTAIQEMVHIEEFAERILFLDGDVVMKPSFEVKQIRDVKQMVEMALALEKKTVEDYNRWAKECSTWEDSVSYKMFEGITAEEEVHQDNFQIELDHMETFGATYLALQSIEHTKNIGRALAGEKK